MLTRLRFTAPLAGIAQKRFFSMSATVLKEDEILSSVSGGLATCTLNRPKVLNSLNESMCHTMLPLYKKWNADPNIKVIALEGEGAKAFCAGGDVVSICKAGLAGDIQPAYNFFETEYILDHYIGSLDKPHIALMDGITMGGGVGLSVHGTYRVATEKTLFAMPETAIGLFPDVGGGHFLPRLEGELGMYLALTGARLKGEDVYHSGVATHFIPSSSIGGLKVALEKCENDAAVKLVLDQFHAIVNDTFSLEPHLKTIDECFAGDKIEDMISKLNASGEWGQKQVATLQKMSPTSCKVSIRQLREGAKKSLGDTLKMELGIAMGCMRNKDFFEGISALLIDKGRKPEWSPASFEEVSDAAVDAYFQKEYDETLKF